MAKKKDIKQVDAIVQMYGMSEEQGWGFRDYIHELKDSGHHGRGKGRAFTFRELRELAKDYLGIKDE